jgi:leucyl-tRNA synthetase
MDTFVDSAWYFARFLDPHAATTPFGRAAADHWLPVDTYIGGPEHSTMHLLYFRFWTMVMRELGLVAMDEPVIEMITQGIVNGPDGRKMSKRWGNVISPAAIVERYGADAARTFVMFAGPHEAPINWSDEAIEGAANFLDRAWRLAYDRSQPPAADRRSALPFGNAARPGGAGAFEAPGDRSVAIRRIGHKALRRVTEDLERKSFNTAIARLMELVNALTAIVPANAAEHAAMAEAIRILAVCLSPFAPHMAEEIAAHYGADQSLQAQDWPAWDPDLAYDDIVTYAIRVDGKVRGEVRMPASDDAEAVRAAAEADASVQPWLAGKQVTDFRFVPGRMVVFKTT